MSGMKDWRGTPLKAGQRVLNCLGIWETLGIVTEVDETTRTVTVRRLMPPAEMVITEDLFLDGFLQVYRPDPQPAASFTDTFFDPALMGPRG